MRRFLPLLLVLCVPPVLAQDGDPAPESGPAAAEIEAGQGASTAAEDEAAMGTAAARSAADDVTDSEIEELLDLDEPWDADAEDDFIPTENVKFEQSIPFPTDI